MQSKIFEIAKQMQRAARSEYKGESFRVDEFERLQAPRAKEKLPVEECA